MYVCMYIYIYIYTYLYACVYAYLYARAYAHLRANSWMCVCVYLYDTANPRSDNSHNEEYQVKKRGDFPLSGGHRPLKNKSVLGLRPQVSRLFLCDLGVFACMCMYASMRRTYRDRRLTLQPLCRLHSTW